MSKLVIGPEGFVDLRRNPPPTSVTVQGYTAEQKEPHQLPVEMVPEPPAEPREEPLPAIQKTTEGLAQSAAPPVAVKAPRPVVLRRIESVDGTCYAVVGRKQHERLARHAWAGSRTGHMYRIVTSATGAKTVLWFHREAAKCYRVDKFVAFLDGDERNCHHSNLQVVATKEEAKAIRRQALARSANG